MNTILTLLLSLLSVTGVTEAVYKRWIPNTNYENSSNWNEKRVPCSQDQAIFAKDQKVSVFVQSSHALTSLHLPLDGEFILSHGAGFMPSYKEDPECGPGSFINFHDTDQYQWFDPTLWQSALSPDDLDNGRFLFAVDAEQVPCQYDDVIFSPATSFRVQVTGASPEIQLRSIHVFGQKFTRNEAFAEYLQSPSGKLQFPGSAHPQVTNEKCQDKTGCTCNNDRMIQEICSALLRHTDNKCPQVPCANPLQPIGQCCGICGAILSLEYTSDFDLETYRNRLIHTFLNLAKYSAVDLAISKVQKTASVLAAIPPGSETKIQVVILDKKEGSLSGTEAQALAYDIQSDIEEHGQSFGITKVEMQFSTSDTTSAQTGSMTAGAIAGIVIGTIIGVAFIAIAVLLYRMDVLKLQYFRLLWLWQNAPQGDSSVQYDGFENPIFEPATDNMQVTPAMYMGEEDHKGIALQQSGSHFTNPVYDGNIDA